MSFTTWILKIRLIRLYRQLDGYDKFLERLKNMRRSTQTWRRETKKEIKDIANRLEENTPLWDKKRRL